MTCSSGAGGFAGKVPYTALFTIIIRKRMYPQRIIIVCPAEDARNSLGRASELYPVLVIHPGSAILLIQMDAATRHVVFDACGMAHAHRHDIVAPTRNGQAQF